MQRTSSLLALVICLMLLFVYMPTFSADDYQPLSSPEVTTQDATGLEETSATLHGTLTADGGEGCSVGFEYGLDTSYGTDVPILPTYIYAGGASLIVNQYWQSNLTKKASTSSYGDWIYALTEDATYVYAGGEVGVVSQYWKSNMTKKQDTASYGGAINALVQDATYIYAGGATTNKIYQYWKSNMTKKVETASYGGQISALSVDNTYVYCGGDTTQEVYQYWKSNMTFKANTEDYGGWIRILSQDAIYIYVGGNTIQTVIQYWKSNMTEKAETADYGGSITALAVDSTYVYASGQSTNKVFQYWKSDMTKKAESATYGGSIDSLAQDATYIYAGGMTTKRVRQYWKTNMTYKTQSASYLGEIIALSESELYQAGDTFSFDATGLVQGKPYHYRAYANNTVGGMAGEDKTFMIPNPNPLILRPISDIVPNWDYNPYSSHYLNVNEVVPDYDTSYIYAERTDGANSWMDSFDLETQTGRQSVITDVQVCAVVKVTADWNSGDYVSLGSKSDGRSLQIYPGTDYALYTADFPSSSYSWSWSDINYVNIFAHIGTWYHEIWCTQLYMKIYYQNVSFSDETPSDANTGVSVDLPSVSIDISSDSYFNWTIGGDSIETASETYDSSGVKTADVNSPLLYGTIYYWWVNASAGENYINNTYSFTTESAPPNNFISKGSLADDNARVYARAIDGTLYVVYGKYTDTEEGEFENTYLASSTDNGTTWANISLSDNNIPFTYSYSATVATGQNGSIYVGWVYQNETAGNTYQIKYRFYQDATWSNILNVTDVLETDTGEFENPAIAVDSLGTVHIVYYYNDYDSGYETIQYVTYDGESFSEPYQLSDVSYYTHVPSIAIDGNDTVYVAWASYDSYYDSSFIQYSYKDIGGWSDIYDVISPSGSYDCYHPVLAIGMDNTAHLVYSNYSYDLDEACIKYVAINYDEWSVPQNVCERGYKGGDSLTVSVDSFDRIYVVWDGRNPDTEIYGIMLNVLDGSWGSPVMLVDNISDTYCNLLSAIHPTYEVQPNIPYSGYTFVFYDDTFQSIYCYFNVTWQEPSGFPAWDINQDGVVNYLDVSSLVSHYGQSGALGWIPEDINDDGIVNYLDISSLVSHYGESY